MHSVSGKKLFRSSDKQQAAVGNFNSQPAYVGKDVAIAQLGLFECIKNK